MPKKSKVIQEPRNPTPEPEPEPEPEGIQEETQSKPKRQMSEAQLLHLATIRKKALEKKRELKILTEKAKLGKSIEKVELAKKYDEYIEKKQEPIPEPKKKLKKVVKKYIEVEGSSEDTEEEEQVIVKAKSKKVQPPQKQPEPSLSQVVSLTAEERLRLRMNDERCRAIISAVQPNYR